MMIKSNLSETAMNFIMMYMILYVHYLTEKIIARNYARIYYHRRKIKII